MPVLQLRSPVAISSALTTAEAQRIRAQILEPQITYAMRVGCDMLFSVRDLKSPYQPVYAICCYKKGDDHEKIMCLIPPRFKEGQVVVEELTNDAPYLQTW